MPAAIKKLLEAIGDRASGAKPGTLRAFVIATSVGFTAGVATYRLLRSGD